MLGNRALVGALLAIVIIAFSLPHAPVTAFDGSGTSLWQMAQADDGGRVVQHPPGRVTCESAPEVFLLMCAAYEVITAHHVDEIADMDLASAAAERVRRAGLVERTDGNPPACPLPSPEFEEVCEVVDLVQDTAFAVEEAVRGMTDSLDPNSSYLTAAEYSRFLMHLENRGNSGLGLAFGLLENGRPCLTVTATCRPVISDVYAGSPAEKGGLRAGDEIVELAGRFPAGLGCDDMSRLDRFEAGEEVKVTVRRDSIMTLTIRAAELAIPVARGMVVDGNIGYLDLDVFGAAADAAVADVLGELTDSSLSGLVLDLRSNPGGYINSAVGTAGLFLPNLSVVVNLVGRDKVETIRARGREISSDPILLPMVIAVNGGSASASEMVTGALSDQDRVTVVGRSTHGKNTGQTSYHLEPGGTLIGVLQITTLRWLTPWYRSATGGFEPDVTMDLPACLLPAEVARRAVSAIRPHVAEVAITSEPNGTAYAVGETIVVTVTFDAPVVIHGSGGNPTLNLKVGDDHRVAVYASGSGTAKLVFEYAVANGDSAPDGVSIPTDSLQRGRTKVGMFAGLEAELDHDAVAPDPRHKVGDLPAPGNRTEVFTDIGGSTHRAGIERIAAAGITDGCGSDASGLLFCPDQAVTRAQVASFLSRALGLPGATRDFFADDGGSVHEDSINRLAEAGIIGGCNSPDGDRFCPDSLVTRAQLATFLGQALNLLEARGDFFADDGGSVHEDSINRIAAAGIAAGCGPDADGLLFCPDQAATRAQMATFLARVLGLPPNAHKPS